MSEADSHYFIDRPLGLGGSNWPAANYPYGSTKDGQLAVHHGVDFAALYGTPLFAVAAGEIVVAGGDQEILYGLRENFYGILVVIQLDQTHNGQPVYALYGHLSQTMVEVGEHVEPGQLIGETGSSGASQGPHLHLEVRLGENDYAHTRNPQLWMKPFEGRGTIAVRVVNQDGQLIRDFPVMLSRAASPRSTYRNTWTYTDDHVNGDDVFGENAVFGDMPPGPYWVRGVVDGHEFAEAALVMPGRTTAIILELPVP